MLPNFLCVGAQKAGTTWLHAELERVSDVFVPTRRKEVHFFDEYYDRGPDWYADFFPRGSEAQAFAAVGEITPMYLYHSEAPQRIKDTLGDPKLIIMLREPVARLMSQYRMDFSRGQFEGSPEAFIETKPDAVARGVYSAQIERYLNLFLSENIQFLVFEEIFASPDATRAALAAALAHLGSVATPQAEGVGRINAEVSTGRPRMGGLYKTANAAADWLRRHDLDIVVNVARRMGVSKSSFGDTATAPPRFQPSTLDRLQTIYDEDRENVEQLLGRPLSVWAKSPAPTALAV